VISLIPISDANPTKRFPIFTIGLIVLNALAFFLLEPGQPSLAGNPPESGEYFVENAPIPCQVEEDCPATFPGTGTPIPERDLTSFLWAVIFSTFLHGNLLHIGGNMLFLWVFGNNVEDYLGPIKYVLFYLLGGIAAGFAQVLANLHGQGSIVPSVGASGAVAAILGAYFVLYPRARVNVLVPIVIIWTVLQLSAFIVLGLWFVYQFVVPQPGVAWQAHVGGFLFGVVAILLLGGRPHKPQPRWQAEWRY
jgi:membrane associated rhomboid family serine protease